MKKIEQKLNLTDFSVESKSKLIRNKNLYPYEIDFIEELLSKHFSEASNIRIIETAGISVGFFDRSAKQYRIIHGGLEGEEEIAKKFGKVKADVKFHIDDEYTQNKTPTD